MVIKVPDNFRPLDYDVKISIPKPDMECRKNEDGSFSFYAGYNFDCMSDIAREAAREIYDKMEAELIDELLRLNDYVPERTCQQVITEYNDGLMPPFIAYCSECGAQWGYTPNYCPNCGARVIE